MIQKINRAEFRYKQELSFNPEDVNVRLQRFRVIELIGLIDTKMFDELKGRSIDFKNDNNDYFWEEDNNLDVVSKDNLQRNTDLWNTIQKSRFIESLMINIPIPIFYLDGTDKKWRVIDGLQRIGSILGFMRNEYALRGLEYLGKDCGGKKIDDPDFPGYLKARILNAELTTYIVNPGTPENVKYNIFQRINTGGLKLNNQEIRNAIFRGKPAGFTEELTKEKYFQLATNNKVTPRRMADKEYANRFIAFQVFDYKDYNGNMNLFLSESLFNLYSREDDDFEQLRNLFRISMKRCYDLFGKKSFYKPKIKTTKDRKQILLFENEPEGYSWGRLPNKAIFDTLSWNISQLSESEFNKLDSRKKNFQIKYFQFMIEDLEMFKAYDNTTSSKTSVITRFSKLSEFINSFLK